MQNHPNSTRHYPVIILKSKAEKKRSASLERSLAEITEKTKMTMKNVTLIPTLTLTP